jgi:integrase
VSSTRQRVGTSVIPERKPPQRVRLTNSLADAVSATIKGEIFWDSEIPGFGLKVTPSGHKTYIFKYRVAGGRGGQQRKPTIGTHGPMTCQQARDMARKWFASVKTGGDPSGERKAIRDAITVSDFCDRFIVDYARLKKKPKSVKGDESVMRRVIKPMLGSMKVSAVGRADVERVHRSLKDTPPHANRIVALLSKMFSLAERWGLRPAHSNPCRGIERYREFARERFLVSEELRRLEAVLVEHERSNPWMSSLIRLLILTGARRGELETLRWVEVELQSGRLRLADSKTGAKVIVLGDKAVEILQRVPKVEGNAFVFAGKKSGQHVNGLSKFWQRVRKQAALEGIRLHDLRHSFASQAAANGASLPMIGKLLGHKSTATTARYAHLLDAPLREIANAVARQI